jgi:hypothetical protein
MPSGMDARHPDDVWSLYRGAECVRILSTEEIRIITLALAGFALTNEERAAVRLTQYALLEQLKEE